MISAACHVERICRQGHLSIPILALEGSGMMNPAGIVTPDVVKLPSLTEGVPLWSFWSSAAKDFHFAVELLFAGASRIE